MLNSRLTAGCLTILTTVMVTACQSAPTVSEEQSASTGAVSATTPAATPDKSGPFLSGEQETQGKVSLFSENGVQKLVFDEAFSTSQGTDLVVLVHRSATPLEETDPPSFPLNDRDYQVIAPLKSLQGSQEYIIPAGLNMDEFQSVAVWCRKMNATFGAATLQ